MSLKFSHVVKVTMYENQPLTHNSKHSKIYDMITPVIQKREEVAKSTNHGMIGHFIFIVRCAT